MGTDQESLHRLQTIEDLGNTVEYCNNSTLSGEYIPPGGSEEDKVTLQLIYGGKCSVIKIGGEQYLAVNYGASPQFAEQMFNAVIESTLFQD